MCVMCLGMCHCLAWGLGSQLMLQVKDTVLIVSEDSTVAAAPDVTWD